MEDFVADQSPNAYEKVVDRLLASPHYGEKWARAWLDVAHYADSDGYEKDLSRPWAWRYRQWVIDALNRDEPFDQFTMQQIAGDLLPNAGTDDRVATGFLRNTLTNREGGVDRNEARFEQIINRTNTVSTTWLGLTIYCAQCHNHKFDPISQKEYYSLFAFFDHAEEQDIDAPMPGEKPPPAEYYAKRQEIYEQYWVAELQPPWEKRLREAYQHPGENHEWDFTLTDFKSSIDRPFELLTDDPGEAFATRSRSHDDVVPIGVRHRLRQGSRDGGRTARRVKRSQVPGPRHCRLTVRPRRCIPIPRFRRRICAWVGITKRSVRKFRRIRLRFFLRLARLSRLGSIWRAGLFRKRIRLRRASP